MAMDIDHEAVSIGLLYQKAQTSEDRVFYLEEAGSRLLKKKESLGHGLWLHWIKANHGALGFGERGIRTLIRGTQWLASNRQLADRLEDIITNPKATDQDLVVADEIRELIACQFRPATRGTLGRRRRDEWYTPAPIVSLARTVLGDIDIDPASTELAQETVKARQYFDKIQNGLQQPWLGRVYLNPPYAPPWIGRFMAKMLMEWDSGRMTACIALTHNYTDTAWFQDVASVANAVCFTQGRIRFYEPGGTRAKPTQGQALFYFGPEVEAFKQTFGRVGLIVRPEPDHYSRRRVREFEGASVNDEAQTN